MPTRVLSNSEIVRNIKRPMSRDEEENAFDASKSFDEETIINDLSKDLLFEEYDSEHALKLNLDQSEARIKEKNFFHKLLQNPLVNKLLISGDFSSAVTDHIPIIKDLPFKPIIDRLSLDSTKTVMIGRYLDSAFTAFKGKRLIEGIGRLMGVVALPLVKLNDLTLASGLGEFIPQLDLAIEGKIKEKNDLTSLENMQNNLQNKETVWDNTKNWLNSLIEAYKEIVEGGFGPDRKIFPDFNFGQIKKMFTNSLKIMAGGDPDEIENKDQGHTLVFAGTLTFIGSFFGVLFGRQSRDLSNKIFGTIRSVGGIIADYTLLMHPDKNMKKAGVVTTLGSIVDGVQRFLPEKYINTINHLNLINSTIGSQIISNRSHEKNDNNVTVYSDDNLMGALA